MKLKLLTFSIGLCASLTSTAACRYVWTDHDFNIATPAIQQQVCDNSLDLPAIRQPSVRPIQAPQIKPIQVPTIAPIGTTSCQLQSVYEGGRWVTKNICY